jgi:hypothetical protein
MRVENALCVGVQPFELLMILSSRPTEGVAVAIEASPI